MYVMKLQCFVNLKYRDKKYFIEKPVSNLAHHVTICNMAWLLHFLTVGDIFSWLEERAYYCNAVVAHCGLFLSKITKKAHFTSKKGTTPCKIRVFFPKINPIQRSRQYKLHSFHNPSVFICLQKYSHKLNKELP